MRLTSSFVGLVGKDCSDNAQIARDEAAELLYAATVKKDQVAIRTIQSGLKDPRWIYGRFIAQELMSNGKPFDPPVFTWVTKKIESRSVGVFVTVDQDGDRHYLSGPAPLGSC